MHFSQYFPFLFKMQWLLITVKKFNTIATHLMSLLDRVFWSWTLFLDFLTLYWQMYLVRLIIKRTLHTLQKKERTSNAHLDLAKKFAIKKNQQQIYLFLFFVCSWNFILYISIFFVCLFVCLNFFLILIHSL